MSTNSKAEDVKVVGPLVVEGKLSDNERLKKESNFLRGTISDDLKNQVTGGMSGDNFQLIRFHGMYQQDDRDIRAERAKQKLEPLHSLMLRARLPGGIITPEQWLGVDKWATEHTMYGSIRLTTRQTFQYHGILKPNIKTVHKALNSIGIDSIATAADMNRNVLCTSNPYQSEVHQEAYEWAKKISEHFLPQTRGYAEVWLDSEKVEDTAQEAEPILGSTYLPRKFKTAVVIPPLNDVDVHGNDLSFVAIQEAGELIGFNVLVGGGLAMTHGDKSTYPRKADDFGFISAEQTIAFAEAVVTTQRDWGNRVNRKNAKTKYTLDRVGSDVFKQEVEKRAGSKFEPSRPYEFTERGDRIGWSQGIDDKHYLALFIENGRIIDRPNQPLKTGMAELAKVHQGDFRITANQNLIVAGVPTSQKAEIEAIAIKYGLMDMSVSEQRKNSMACVAFPTCPLAMAEAERYLPTLVTDVEGILTKHNISNESIILRVTGCPNGCGRAMLAEIGLVGKGPGKYNMHLGGNLAGTRVPKMYKENLDEQSVLFEIDHLVERWVAERNSSEAFGDYVIRSGIIAEVKVSKQDFYD
ncbi:assimilatory sulfite reductase (NADPH) hemoprotein subunit [Thalassotalea piscium]|uniref:Sulfite reductase [NADPH] hemoprotein beta-component n=1 Tax=Thalassotalea piscium TaxID=1230533 RepID=A0A7X0TUL9_9GAMM|nr:assimilatory sulfite reductase (NADPH) hemoprotein subunit [Thalassotalea piscium]MBB6544215.1 sulfite reductase (NADPH) hemoprotein beta-component [Thalassotalea piscium]